MAASTRVLGRRSGALLVSLAENVDRTNDGKSGSRDSGSLIWIQLQANSRQHKHKAAPSGGFAKSVNNVVKDVHRVVLLGFLG